MHANQGGARRPERPLAVDCKTDRERTDRGRGACGYLFVSVQYSGNRPRSLALLEVAKSLEEAFVQHLARSLCLARRWTVTPRAHARVPGRGCAETVDDRLPARSRRFARHWNKNRSSGIAHAPHPRRPCRSPRNPSTRPVPAAPTAGRSPRTLAMYEMTAGPPRGLFKAEGSSTSPRRRRPATRSGAARDGRELHHRVQDVGAHTGDRVLRSDRGGNEQRRSARRALVVEERRRFAGSPARRSQQRAGSSRRPAGEFQESLSALRGPSSAKARASQQRAGRNARHAPGRGRQVGRSEPARKAERAKSNDRRAQRAAPLNPARDPVEQGRGVFRGPPAPGDSLRQLGDVFLGSRGRPRLAGSCGSARRSLHHLSIVDIGAVGILAAVRPATELDGREPVGVHALNRVLDRVISWKPLSNRRPWPRRPACPRSLEGARPSAAMTIVFPVPGGRG